MDGYVRIEVGYGENVTATITLSGEIGFPPRNSMGFLMQRAIRGIEASQGWEGWSEE